MNLEVGNRVDYSLDFRLHPNLKNPSIGIRESINKKLQSLEKGVNIHISSLIEIF